MKTTFEPIKTAMTVDNMISSSIARVDLGEKGEA